MFWILLEDSFGMVRVCLGMVWGLFEDGFGMVWENFGDGL